MTAKAVADELTVLTARLREHIEAMAKREIALLDELDEAVRQHEADAESIRILGETNDKHVDRIVKLIAESDHWRTLAQNARDPQTAASPASFPCCRHCSVGGSSHASPCAYGCNDGDPTAT